MFAHLCILIVNSSHLQLHFNNIPSVAHSINWKLLKQKRIE